MPVGLKIHKVILGMSGGIDSSVAALILKKQGYDVSGLFMRNWNIADETGKCSIDQDFQDASRVCSIIGIPLKEANFSKEYWNFVFTDLIDQYQNGQTPNPDILCNRHIKFNKFFKYAIEKYGADAIATGHYAQTSFGPCLESYDNDKGVHLLKAVDKFKDQTFFLSQVHQDALQKTIFPLGSLTKTQVKKIALENNLFHVLKKRESTGICFIGKRNFPSFISEYLSDSEGSFVDVDTGIHVGRHRGIHHWTLGQRCRIGGNPDRLYVAKKYPNTQEILVAMGKHHLILWSKHITTSLPHWVHSAPDILTKGGVLHCDFRFQHTKPLISCKVIMKDNQSLIITLEKPLFALTPGQFAVLYKNNECLGGAKIENTAPNQYTLNNIYKLSQP
uniref:tRNA-5-taurinomethyluridine 2-sulfurtransferase n=1 Tax=Graphocephala atropunctata TaxID=36148 RepID=A0A1B6M3Q8_9HEMI